MIGILLNGVNKWLDPVLCESDCKLMCECEYHSKSTYTRSDKECETSESSINEINKISVVKVN